MSKSPNEHTGSKPADPYKAANKEDDLPLNEKIETSDKFVTSCKYESGGVDQVFFTNMESKKMEEVESTISLDTERGLVKKYFSITLKVWLGDLGDGVHDGSDNDPRIGIMKVNIVSATYSVSDKTSLSFAAEVAKGAVTEQPPIVKKMREISESEIRSWRASH
ncbi:hypothetical protein F5Y05DRAFT_402006 [Hypoxylon sp. FL0543]|nr:hypothetical protein F5Y05DRAFT_402006 [Hypoxylon sp. FL0543]